jgi:signal transduction histidine kinase
VLHPAAPTTLDARRGHARAWHLETVDLLAKQLREILEALDLHRRRMRMERSKANINLARNLGHDLTNIIATSKLDIRTVKKVLEMTSSGDAEVDGPPRLLREAMGGLLNSTRLLQEVVNIYRSFSYIGRPRFEAVAINNVLDEIIDVFALSLPASTVVRRDYREDLPECTVEPRLLKLALFNLLTNAVAAIKRNPDPQRREGQITVSTRMDPESDRVCISVRDNGTGILNGEGKTATQTEIDRIFRYGVSTKKEDGGEGLGLSWVWTIVEEFHKGRVEARNHADGGAEFLVSIGTDLRHEHMET